MTTQRLIFTSALSIVLVCVPWATADTVGTTFTYQGVLADAGTPAGGTFDFRVFLYDAEAGGSQVGSTVLVGGVPVTDGRVTLDLDFGDVFDGTALWLEVHVREAGTATYLPLWPRQGLTATPFAIHAAEAVYATSALWADDAGSALSANDAVQLGGHVPSYYLSWSNLVDVPVDLNDGDDDTLGFLSCATGEVAKWSGTAWTCADDEGGRSNTYFVGSGGNPTENGTALVAAVAALPAATESAQILVYLEPGTYDLGSNSLILLDWISLEGAGQTLTVVTSAVDGDYATINMGMDSVLRGMTVLNTSTGTYSYALKADHRSQILDVTAVSEGNASRCRGISSVGDDLVVENAHFEVLSGTADHSCYAIWGVNGMTLKNVNAISNGSSGLLGAISSVGTDPFVAKNLSVSATGTSTSAYGIWSANSDIRLTNVIIEVESDTSSANGLYTPGVNYRTLTLDTVTVSAVGGSGSSYGLRIEHLLNSSIFDQVTATGTSRGLYLTNGSGPLTIRNSHFAGSDYGVTISVSDSPIEIQNSTLTGDLYALLNNGDGPVTIAVSQLANGTGGNPTVCAGVWDENHTFYPDTCP